MGKITIRRPEDTEFERVSDWASDEMKSRYGAGELSSRRRAVLPVDGESLQLFEVALEPDAEIEPHAHSSSEIIVVTDGEIRFGAQRCGAGTVVFVDADTLYGFRSGPAGARFLNFRPVASAAYVTKDEYLAKRS